MRLCGILGHKWDESDPYRQNCTRRGCYTSRYLHYKKYTKIGVPAIDWTILDIQKLKFKDQNKMRKFWDKLPEYAKVIFVFVGCAVGVVLFRQLIALILWVI